MRENEIKQTDIFYIKSVYNIKAPKKQLKTLLGITFFGKTIICSLTKLYEFTMHPKTKPNKYMQQTSHYIKSPNWSRGHFIL